MNKPLSKKIISIKFKQHLAGVVLLESLIAILIFSMGILAIAGLQASMLKNTSDSKYRADASYIAQQHLARMWADPANIANYATDDAITTLLPAGRRIVTYRPADGVVRIIVQWQVPGEATHNYEVNARIMGVS